MCPRSRRRRPARADQMLSDGRSDAGPGSDPGGLRGGGGAVAFRGCGDGARGSPAAAVLRCGVPVAGPTTRPCFTSGAVDRVAQPASGRRVRFDTFGRSPQLEAVIDGSRVNSAGALAELSAAIRPAIPSPFMRCLGSSSPTR